MNTLVKIILALIVLLIIFALLTALGSLISTGGLFPIAQGGYQVLHAVATGGK